MPKTKNQSLAVPGVASTVAGLKPWWDRTAGHYLFKAEVVSKTGTQYTLNLYRTTDNALLANNVLVDLADDTNDRYFTDWPTTIQFTNPVNKYGYLAMSVLGGAPEDAGEKWPPAFRKVRTADIAQALQKLLATPGTRQELSDSVQALAALLETEPDAERLRSWSSAP